jgi:competence protein ComEC
MRKSLVYSIGFISLLIILVVRTIIAWPDSKLKLIACDVGQGDAILISKGYIQILYDGGPSSEKLMSCLERFMPFWDDNLELVIASHGDKDHVAGLNGVLRKYNVGKMVWNGFENSEDIWQEVMEIAVETEVDILKAYEVEEILIDDIFIDFLWPESDVGFLNDNAKSVVVKLKYGDFKILLTGDIDCDIESELMSAGIDLESDILKVAHHGSDKSSCYNFLQMVNPKYGVIGVGKNSYGHPSERVISELQELGSKVKRTDEEGDIVIEIEK